MHRCSCNGCKLLNHRRGGEGNTTFPIITVIEYEYIKETVQYTSNLKDRLMLTVV